MFYFILHYPYLFNNLFYRSRDFLFHFLTLLFSETHFTNAETCNFFMTLKSLIYFARSLMRLAGQNGTRAFYEPPEGQFLFKKRMVRTDRVTGIFTVCLRGANLPHELHSNAFIDGRRAFRTYATCHAANFRIKG